MFTLDAVQKKKTREILVQTNSMKLDTATLESLQKILKEHKGATPVKLELCDLAVTPAVRVQVQAGGGLNIQNGGVAALKTLFGDENVQPMGPNRRMKRQPVPATDAPLIAPSDELLEVG